LTRFILLEAHDPSFALDLDPGTAISDIARSKLRRRADAMRSLSRLAA
jgi:hypothetical protein